MFSCERIPRAPAISRYLSSTGGACAGLQDLTKISSAHTEQPDALLHDQPRLVTRAAAQRLSLQQAQPCCWLQGRAAGATLDLQINGVSLLKQGLQQSLAKQAAELAYQVTSNDPFPELQDYSLHVQVTVLCIHVAHTTSLHTWSGSSDSDSPICHGHAFS